MYLFVLTAALAAGTPVSPLVAKLEKAGYVTGFFTETVFHALTMEEETARGTMHLAPPDLFKLAYDDPEGMVTGYDGKILYTIDPDSRQVLVYDGEGPGNFLYLLGCCDDSTACAAVTGSGDSLSVILEGDFGGGIRLMEVGFTLSDSMPFFFSTTDFNGNRTSYRLEDLSIYDTIPAGVFDLEVPEGYLVLEPGDM